MAFGVGLRASARWDMERTPPLPCMLSSLGGEMMGTHSLCPRLLVTATACSTASCFSYLASNEPHSISCTGTQKRFCWADTAYHTLHKGINYAESSSSFCIPTPTLPEDHLKTPLPSLLEKNPNFQAKYFMSYRSCH